MKFICDQMVLKLGKWLRAAGYDTLMVQDSMADSKIWEIALKENRILVTRDRHFLKMDGDKNLLIYLKGNDPKEWIKELNEKLQINWVKDPFSRCLICNTYLVETTDPLHLEQVPTKVREDKTKFWCCPQCEKVYWYGSHTEKMKEQLTRFSPS